MHLYGDSWFISQFDYHINNKKNVHPYFFLKKNCTLCSRARHLVTLDLEIQLDRKHHFGEKVVCLVKYVDSIDSNGHFDSALETGNSISIHICVSKCQTLLWQKSYFIFYLCVRFY
jgi:hypothetical protein